MLKVDKKIDDIDGLRKWISETPMPRTSSSHNTLDHLRSLYRSEYFRKHMCLNLDLHTRIDRWSMYKQQQAVIAHICHYLTEGLDCERATLCFGDATFNTSSRGHMASPSSMRQFVDYLRRDGWHVITVWEFNTSQVCSRCHHELKSGEFPYRLCNVGSFADGHAFCHRPTNNHSVKRCTRCRTIWNRGFNAALNIAYLGMLQYYQRQRPLHFRKGLSKPPAYVARQMAQAAERAAAAFSSETAAPVAPETAETAVASVAPATDVAPVAPVAPVDGAEAVLSNSKRRLLMHRETRKKRAKARRELRRAEVLSITAFPKDYIQRLAKACPAPDPETERQKAYNRVKKGEEKRADKKEESKKPKIKVKRTADDSATASNESPSKKARKTAPKK
ncbi:hypothetical protein H4218_003838 [Coemansia sp. IMI 209128]|nr:hypothetical protein H4218_003838 [Coemansia sp. IMI 209128]